MRLDLSSEEKSRTLSIVKVWKRDAMNFDTFRAMQVEWGVPARLVETVFWHLDTLDALGSPEWLVFKGGTCVQSYIKPEFQRASVGLDFNTDIQNPNAVMDAVKKLNVKLREEERAVTVRGVDFGSIEFDSRDIRSGTLNFKRRMPSRFGEFERVAEMDAEIQSKSIRIQINYKHARMPALKTVDRQVSFFVQESQRPLREVRFVHASREDLFADKLLAVCNVGGFGRERFKDVYDLIVLSRDSLDEGMIVEKLNLVGKGSGLDAGAITRGVVETVSSFSENSREARGFASTVCKGGKKLVEDWEGECVALIGFLSELKG